MSLSPDFRLFANLCNRKRLNGVLPNGLIKQCRAGVGQGEEEIGNDTKPYRDQYRIKVMQWEGNI